MDLQDLLKGKKKKEKKKQSVTPPHSKSSLRGGPRFVACDEPSREIFLILGCAYSICDILRESG